MRERDFVAGIGSLDYCSIRSTNIRALNAFHYTVMDSLEATKLLQRILVQKFGFAEEHVQPAQTLSAIGVDSLSGLELMFEVEERLGVRLPPELLSPSKTISELASSLGNYVEEHTC